MRVYIPVSAGDLIDRITILRIKKSCIPGGKARANVAEELDQLVAIRACFPKLSARPIRALETALARQNRALWRVEDRLRALEARGDFGKAFVAAARKVYTANDERARLKREINDRSGSALREEKWFSAPR
jgi:hypothetical protein